MCDFSQVLAQILPVNFLIAVEIFPVMQSTRCRLPPDTNRQLLRKAYFH